MNRRERARRFGSIDRAWFVLLLTTPTNLSIQRYMLNLSGICLPCCYCEAIRSR